MAASPLSLKQFVWLSLYVKPTIPNDVGQLKGLPAAHRGYNNVVESILGI